MARIDTTQSDAILAILEHFRSFHSLDNSQAYLGLFPDAPIIPHGGTDWYMLSPGDGQFDEGLFDGGGEDQCNEQSTLTVTGYCRTHLDPTDRDDALLTDSTTGLLEAKRKILRALAGKDVTLSGGDTFLRELLTPIRASAPTAGKLEGEGLGVTLAFTSVDFLCSFDWDLS